jgi:CheY-like chemotaxis protein
MLASSIMAAGRTSSGQRTRAAVVLLVDDCIEWRSLCAEVLTRGGFAVVESGDGRDAVAKARAVRPDVIVMNISLPVMDGAAAARVLKTYPPTQHIPMIALTGHPRAVVNAAAMGFHDVLVRPCEPETLLDRLQVLIACSTRARSRG